MKRIQITLLALIFCSILAAQEDYTQSLDGIEWVKVESKADIIVRTHGEKQLRIKAKASSKKPEKAKGLKLLGAGGSDNTDVGFYVVKEGNNLIVRNLRKWNNGNAEIYLPANQNISVTTNGTGQSDIRIYGFKGEIEANARLNGGIKIEDVSGPVTANSLNGGIDISFVEINQDSPITVYSTNGALDIKLPGDTPANLSLGSVNGEIYTNFEIKFPEKNGLKSVSTQKIRQTINGGGVKLQLKTTNGNIYLRKE
ncbi:DUF4097 domain-containing protein [Maribacter algarum]|uniref:DUF4097 domain-containing protein n=1 Tax=Maribacter algarum (ex Zhang et al. 2020) TaxID=2578118 RepID=A0A5S3PUI4_9FLAO|nr:DUF4097 family beta strand repeat-containing protein [Maribacter algarum]TMM58669.1 DUF4097 domain-containing protein [Maribacter algarum]